MTEENLLLVIAKKQRRGSADHLFLLRKMIAPYNIQISAVELTEPKYGLRQTAKAGTVLIYAAITNGIARRN